MFKGFAALICALITAAWGGCSQAAIGTPVYQGFASATNTSLTVSLTPLANMAASDVMFLLFQDSNVGSVLSSCVTSTGEIFSGGTSQIAPGAGIGVIRLFYVKLAAPLTTAGSVICTQTLSSSTAKAIIAGSVSGVNNFDIGLNGTATTAANPSLAISGASGAARQLVVVGFRGAQNITASAAGYASLPGLPNAIDLEWTITTSTPNGTTPTFTAASGVYGIQGLVFEEATTGGPKRALMGVGR